MSLRFFLLWSLLLCPSGAWAHRPSDSYLQLRADDGNTITGQWAISLRDLDYALDLDQNKDRILRWGEVRTQFPLIAHYALARLKISVAGQECPNTLSAPMIEKHGQAAYAVLHFTLACPAAAQSLSVEYRLFFDLDAQHRGLLRWTTQGQSLARIFSPKQTQLSLSLAHPALWPTFTEYLREGTWHIAIGLDHILFLLTLLLPAVLIARNAKSRQIFTEVIQVVTAFTLAHSLTLGLATLGYLSLPSQWVESAIAASVLLAALNNIVPFLGRRRWLIAFAFGLLHGFGFASVLADLGLPNAALGWALFAFNLGVEAGQLAIVFLFLPLAIMLKDSWFYRIIIYTLGSIVIALIAFLWLLERSLDITL